MRHEPRFAFVEADIGDYDAVARALEGADAAVSFAAGTHVDRSILDPDVSCRPTSWASTPSSGQPATPACALPARSRRTRCTATWGRGLYGGGPPQAPQSVRRQQGRGDLLAFSYHTNFGLPVLVTRGANTIGPYQYPEKATPSSSPTPWLTSPSVYGDGTARRHYLYVDDHAGESDLVLQRGTPGRLTTWAPRTRWTPCNWPRASSTLGQAPQPDPLRPRPPRPRLPLQPGQP